MTHTPHTLVEVLFLSIAKDLKIKTIFRRGLSIADFYTYETNIFDYKFKFNKKNNHNKIDNKIKQFIKKYNGKFNTIDEPKSKWLDYSLINFIKNINILTILLLLF